MSLLPASVLLPLSTVGLRGRRAARLGLNPPPFLKEARSIWIHALSVGEFLSALPLLEALKGRYPHIPIAFSVATEAGMRIAKERLRGRAEEVFYMPIDLLWNNVRLIRRLRPAVFLLVETDLWPGLLSALKKRGIPRVLVNGRISPATLRAYRRFPFAARSLYRNISLCLMQSGIDRERLVSFLGSDYERILVTGNIKFDRSVPPLKADERKGWLELMGFGEEDLVLVAGSTHRGEEKILLDVFSTLLPLSKGLRLIIAPRRREECALALKTASELGLRAVLRSSLPVPKQAMDVVVMDTIGELERVYGLAAVSFVGGSLVPVGGHNLLEPAGHGSPVLFGPHVENFLEMSDMLLSAGGAVMVKDKEDLASAFKILLFDQRRRSDMGKMARQAVQLNTGAVARVLREIESLVGFEAQGREEGALQPTGNVA